MIRPGLTFRNIRYVSRLKWSNPGKGVASCPTPQCISNWKGSLMVANFTYLYIFASGMHKRKKNKAEWEKIQWKKERKKERKKEKWSGKMFKCTKADHILTKYPLHRPSTVNRVLHSSLPEPVIDWFAWVIR